jgi:AAA+ ATPase superfamily predicted ATPase
MSDIIGRKQEEIILANALESTRPELIVVYGRRRIGKEQKGNLY